MNKHLICGYMDLALFELLLRVPFHNNNNNNNNNNKYNNHNHKNKINNILPSKE
jgi:hypothetical protein